MASLYRATEWESGAGGRWYVEDTSKLAVKNVDLWIVPCRILNISLKEYIIMLKDKYHAEVWGKSDGTFLGFYFNSLAEARAYKNMINAAARKVNFLI